MNQRMGLLREVLAGIGGALISFGLTNDVTVATVIGVVMAGLTLGVAVMTHKGIEAVKSAARKFLSVTGGALVTFGILSPEQTEALTGAILPILAMYWSTLSNAEPKP